MSKVQVDTIVDKDDISAPTLSKGAIVTGVCTATTFVGAVTGAVTGDVTGNADTATTATNAQGLTGSPNITVTDVNATGVTTTGIGTVTTSVVVGSAVTANSDGVIIAGVATVGTGISMPDNAKAYFGTGGDLSIYHDASNSRIKDTGTGALKLSGSEVAIENSGTTETMATFVENGASSLYYDNSKKFETTSSGVDITGSVYVNGSPLSAAPTVDLVADGSISNNVSCNITSAGKVQAITEIAAGTNTAALSSGGGVSYPRITYDTEHNLFAMFYVQSNDLKCKVGTPTGSGSTSTITWGTAQDIVTSHTSVGYVAAEFISYNDTNKHILGYIANGTSLYCVCVDIAANGTVTAGTTEHVTNSVITQNVEVANGHETSYPFLLFYVYSSTYELQSRDGSVNTGTNAVSLAGNTNAVGSSSDYFRDPIFAFNYLTDRTTVMARANNNQMKYNTRVSGSWKSSTNFGGSTVTRLTMFYDSTSAKVIAFYFDNGEFKYDTGDVSTSNAYIDFSGSPTTQLASNISAFSNWHSPVAYDTANSKYWFLYSRDTPSQKTFLWGFTVSSAGVLTFDADAKEIAAAEVGPIGAIYESSLGNVVAFSADNGYTSYNAASTMDTQNYLGWSSAAYSDGDTATIKVVGNTVTGLSGLTPGKTYYLQRDGTVATTAVTGLSVIGGTSLTDTSLLITKSY